MGARGNGTQALNPWHTGKEVGKEQCGGCTEWTHLSHVLAVPSPACNTMYCSEAGSFYSHSCSIMFLCCFPTGGGEKPRTAAASMRMKPSSLVICGPAWCGAKHRGPRRGDQAEFLAPSMVTPSECHSPAPMWRTSKLGVGLEQEWILPAYGRQRVRPETPFRALMGPSWGKGTLLQRRAPPITTSLPWASLSCSADEGLTCPLSLLNTMQRDQDGRGLSFQRANSPKGNPIQPTFIEHLLITVTMFFLWRWSSSWPWRASRLVSQWPDLLTQVLRVAAAISGLTCARHLHLHKYV